MRASWRHLTYANVTATLCLFLLLGGGAAFAATQLPKGSVGSVQLKSGAVGRAKIKAHAVTGAKVALGTLGKVPSAHLADTAADAATLQGNPASAFVRGGGTLLTARRDLQIGESAQMLALPGIGTLSVTCITEGKKPVGEFIVHNQSGGALDQTLEYADGTDGTTVANGDSIGVGGENTQALRVKLASRTAPITVATLDLSKAAAAPAPCGLFAQVLISTSS
jgi:hypothetical protein